VSGARHIARTGSFPVYPDRASQTPTFEGGPVSFALEKNLQMNARIDGYLDQLPDPSLRRRFKSSKKSSRSPSTDRRLEIAGEPNSQQEQQEPGAWKRRSINIGKYARRRSRDLSSIFK
jgi:hypothetical protein